MLMEKHVPFKEIDVRTLDGKIDTGNPLDKIPTLRIDSEPLYDSRVITGALEGLYPEPGLLPKDTMERALVRRLEALCDGLCDVVIPVVTDQRRPPTMQDQALNDKRLGKARAALDQLEEATREPYLYRQRFSLADIACVSALGYIGLRMPHLLEGYTTLAGYHERQLERPSLAETVPPQIPPPPL